MRKALAFTWFAWLAMAQGPENVLLVVNERSALSRSIADYYALKRGIPLANICRLKVTPDEEISRETFNSGVAGPIATFLRAGKIQDQILYVVTTAGVPLRIAGTIAIDGDAAAVDSELACLYADMRTGGSHRLNGAIPNPYFAKKNVPFRHPEFPLYLVTRLTGYSFADVRGEIDRALLAKNRGKFVIDLKSSTDEPGNDWLRDAALALPKDRVVFDETEKVLSGEQDVIGYASWGSNDRHRKERALGFRWLPGAIMTEFVSTNARSFQQPPDAWRLGTWADPKTWFLGSPQTMVGDYLHEGVTGASGHVFEPYLHLNARPDFLLPAYYRGQNLAESFYVSIPGLSWMNVVVGDPLCRLGPPTG